MNLIVLDNYRQLPNDLKPCITISAASWEAAERIFKYAHKDLVIKTVYQVPTGATFNFYFEAE